MGSVAADPALEVGAAASTRAALSRLVAVAAAVVAVDQLTKWWALEALTQPSRHIDLIWTLRLRVIYNTGTAFSLTSDSGPIVSVVAVVVVAVVVWSARSQRSTGVLAAYGLIVGGTVGNVADRVFRDGDGLLGGPVIDFVDLQWFPVFNVADAALVIGIGLLLVLGVRGDTDAVSGDVVDQPASAPESDVGPG